MDTSLLVSSTSPDCSRHRGLPKRQTAAQRRETGRKPPSFFIERRKQHSEAGPTPFKPADTTEVSKRSVEGKWNRFCRDELHEDPGVVLKNLGSAEIKTFFDWIEQNFTGSVKADGSLSNYWRVLKGLYYDKTFKVLDENVVKDCINYRREVSKRMGLRRRPNPKPVSKNDDLLHFLVVHLVWDDSVFPDEAQRFYLFPGMNLSCISGCRAVSLFDTRKQIDESESLGTGEPYEESDPRIQGQSSQALDLTKDHPCESDLGDFHMEQATTHEVVDRKSAASGRSIHQDGTELMDLDSAYGAILDDDDLTDLDYESDISTVTDDGYLGGDDETRTILWRHVSFRIVRNPVPGMPNLLSAVVSLVNTKGQDRNPRVKQFVIEHEDNPLFDLLGQLLAMAFHDEIFLAKFRDVEEIYSHDIPIHRRGLELKIKREKLDIPIFREATRSPNGYRTSPTVPLKARTWSRYMQRMGKKGGSKENLTQKVWRRGTINAINNKAPSSVRDQIADHDSNAVKYYINETVECDTAAIFFERPSNEAIQKEARLMTLLADMTAPTDLTDEQKIWISQRPLVRRLRSISRKLTDKIRLRGYRSWKAAEGTDIYEQKQKVDKKLNQKLTQLRSQLKEKNRQRHFRDADTIIINEQLGYGSHLLTPKPNPPVYSIPERAEMIRLTCHSPADLTKEAVYSRRLECIRLWIRWQDRQERPRRGQLAVPSMRPQPVLELPTAEIIAEKYQKKQCPFCVGNLSMPRHERERPFARVNKMWDHVESIHQQELAAFDSSKIPCSICEARNITYIPPSVSDFQNHTQEVHNIRLRNPYQLSSAPQLMIASK